MNSKDNKDDFQNIRYKYRGTKEIIKSLLQTPFGFHQIVVYPSNIEMLRELYSHYINRLLEDSNEMVIFLPYHESSESVKNILDLFNSNMDKNNDNKNNNDKDIIDIKKYINNGSLVIIDSNKISLNLEHKNQNENDTMINKNNINSFPSLLRMSISHAKKLKKIGITILVDYGFIYGKENGYEKLLELEKSIPLFFEHINIKQICLYNQIDFFNTFTKQQKKEILDLHSRSIIIMDS